MFQCSKCGATDPESHTCGEPLKYAEHGVVSWVEYERVLAERDRAVQALRDILNPIGKLRRELPDDRVIDGPKACRWADLPETPREIAAAALAEIEPVGYFPPF